jgi:hypothetical protein
MPLAWNEIRHRAIKFANEWPTTESESADKQTFWNEFFEVFGVARKTVIGYRKEPFPSDRARVEFLFQLYEQLTAPLLPPINAKRKRRAN